MKQTRVFLVGLSPVARPVARAAAALAFSKAEIIEVDGLEATRQRAPLSRPDLLVLLDPDELTAAGAILAVDARGLPRWAVVILGKDPSQLAESVPEAEWNPPLLARVFRAALLQHELLNENLRLRGDLKTVARRISHDLRTPIGCIYTSSHILKVLPADDAPAIGATIQGIEDSSMELSRIIDRVSFVLKASTDSSETVKGGMGPLVATVLTDMEPEIKKAGATVVQPSTWPEVTGVPAWLEAIWRALLGNALKHGGEGAEIQIGYLVEAGEYRFSVADRGPGLSPAMEALIFQPFDRLHAVVSAGLGLSLVQRLVSLQGGTCGYERRPDGWSVFYFTLPKGTNGTREGDSPKSSRSARKDAPALN